MSIDVIDRTFPFSFAPGLVLGYRKNGLPIYAIAGGAEDTSEFDSDMDKEGEESTEGEETEEETEETEEEDKPKEKEKEKEKKLTPLEQENARLKQRLAKTRQESAARRMKIEEMTRQSESVKDGSEAEKAAREAREAGRVEAEGKLNPKLHKLAGRTALLQAGVKPNKVSKALRLLDFDEVEIDENGEVTGLEDAIDELKEEWSEMFASEEEGTSSIPKPRVKSRDVNGANRDTGKERKPKTSSDLILERLIGKI